MNIEFRFVIWMAIGLFCYIIGIVFLFYHTYSMVKKRVSWLIPGLTFEKNKDPKLYDDFIGKIFVTGILNLVLGFVLLIVLFYMILGLIDSILILILFIVVAIFLIVNVRKRLKIIFEKQEELRRKNIQQKDESILQKLSK